MTELKRNEALSFDDGLLTVKMSGHGQANGWATLAFNERQFELDDEGYQIVEIPPSELFELRDFLNRILPAHRPGDQGSVGVAATPTSGMHEALTRRVLDAWRIRFPNNAYAWPAASTEFASSAVKVVVACYQSDEETAGSRPEPAATPVSQGRNQIAGFLLARDEDYAATPHLLAWAERLIEKGRDAEHDGDCTKQSYTCLRCTADRALADADRVIALAAAPKVQEGGPADGHGYSGPFTATEFNERAWDHEKAAKNGMAAGPNVSYVRTFEACAVALRYAAKHMTFDTSDTRPVQRGDA